jgi:hypothetical protein
VHWDESHKTVIGYWIGIFNMLRSKLFKNDPSTLSIDKIIVTKLEGNEFAISYPVTVGSRTWLVTPIK